MANDEQVCGGRCSASEKKKGRTCDEQKEILASVVDDYNPWGKPGHGAPNDDGLRKRKIFQDPPSPPLKEVSNDVTKMGRPGGGAPVKTTSGKMRNFKIEDPQLRFQFHAPDRNMVDNDFRYRTSIKEQRVYKSELDEMVREKQEIVAENRKQDLIKDKQLGFEDGKNMHIGSHPNDNPEVRAEKILIEEITGGVELAPLLAMRKKQEIMKWPLHSSDVTEIYDAKSNFSIDDKEYNEFLQRQISSRQHRIQHEHEEEMLEGQKHNQNWQDFWGKPGGGAPKGPMKQKENLDYILYQLPVINRMKEQEEKKNCKGCNKKTPEK
ncbi:uncharacterized protein LOC126847374 isoform X2 [Adelges cooleyi]|uniref:uncharacterized protein LOC126847374 isoform X2 n=1 Tax=Adelges cooleyi TaxID=133065 RepID=UPI0021806C93|nr:uncharacterized protein LOC126847374 isoform X2 [Adelges cooleyi]